LILGAGNGGRTGDEPPSKVELVEKAGDAGDFVDCWLPVPSSAVAAGGGGVVSEDVVTGLLSMRSNAFPRGQYRAGRHSRR